ncbi:MAG: Rieske 2Fe-2S domain-containing protein [Myxococcota bacterium]
MQSDVPTILSPFPNQWYLAAFSHHLKVGEVKTLKMLDRELVCFRTQDGKAHVVDPHCPHFGAHLGYGSKVVENCIRCPFHGWQYDAESGQCTHIPNGDPIPPKASLTHWHVDEVSGMVLVWYHADGAPPEWHVQPLPGFDDGKWTSWVEHEWIVDAHIQDISENDADTSHSPIMHDFIDHKPDAESAIDGALFTWKISMRPKLTAFGIPLNVGIPEGMSTRVTSHRWGLAIGWITQAVKLLPWLHMRTQSLALTTPIDRTRCRLNMIHRVHKVPIPFLTTIMRRTYAKTFGKTVEQDISVWEHKVYLTRPIASASDAGVMQFRRWARQFYSGDKTRRSVRLEEQSVQAVAS